jgi:hypothetical protein
MSTRMILIPGNLVPQLREGVQSKLGSALSILTLAVEGRFDATAYQDALGDFDVARALLDEVGLTDEDPPQDLQLDLSKSPELVLKALERQHRREVERLQDAAADGVPIPPREVPALGSLVAEVRRTIGAPRRTARTESFLERHYARRRRRIRGDG